MVDLFNGTRIIVPLTKSIDSDYLNNTMNYIKSLINIDPVIVVKKHTLGWILSIDLVDIFLSDENALSISNFFKGCCHIEVSDSSNYMRLFKPDNLKP